MDSSAIASIERQRMALEDNIAKLRKALRHWQTLEVDYEGLQEEFQGLPQDSSPEECLKAAKDCNSDLVNQKELQELLVDTSSRPRRPAQLVNLLSNRVDYVTRNVETIRKQLSDAERKRNALLLAEEPDHRDEAGLPLAEIIEELDESGNIVTSKVQTPGSEAPQLLESLKKAGVGGLRETIGTITKVISPKTAADRGVSDSVTSEGEVDLPLEPQSGSEIASSQYTSSSRGQPAPQTLDTPEEAELRQDMLDYSRGLDEVGAIVAELELEEEGSDISYDERHHIEEADSETDEDEDLEDDSEDEAGKSKVGLSLSRDYQKKMKKLQEKLGLQNVGPEPDGDAAFDRPTKEQRPPAAEAARKAAIARNESLKKSSLKTTAVDSSRAKGSIKEKASKKKVAFASGLDIAVKEPAGATPTNTTPPSQTIEIPQLRPVSESIVEREAAGDEVEPSAPAAPTQKVDKQSRFKAARQAQPQTPKIARSMDFPPQNFDNASARPLVSAKLVERPSTKATMAPDPNDFSEADHQREIAREYEQHRIKRILAQEGRFLGNAEEGEITPLENEETGRRVSRFKAARVKR